jgi:hypothetical protein
MHFRIVQTNTAKPHMLQMHGNLFVFIQGHRKALKQFCFPAI